MVSYAVAREGGGGSLLENRLSSGDTTVVEMGRVQHRIEGDMRVVVFGSIISRSGGIGVRVPILVVRVIQRVLVSAGAIIVVAGLEGGFKITPMSPLRIKFVLRAKILRRYFSMFTRLVSGNIKVG